MNILITNIQLTVPGGTVSYVKDLAEGLRNRGFTVEIYTSKIGVIGNKLIQSGFNVVTRLTDLIHVPQIIHAHHNTVTMDVLNYFRTVPVVFFLHDKTSLFDHPVKHTNIVKHIAVDFNCLERLLQQGEIDVKYTTVIYNWVNTDRFKLRECFNDKPLNALVFSNYATKGNYYRIIEEACKRAGIKLSVIGSGMDNSVQNPEELLGQYDLVFAKAKAAMEAMASGAAVILCDAAGMGEMVTTANVDHFRKFNFGRRMLTRDINADSILSEINTYDSMESRMVAQRIIHEASFEKSLDQLIYLYKNSIAAYSRGEKGPAGNMVFQQVRFTVYRFYFYFTGTSFFKYLSAIKYRVKNALNQLKHK